MQVRINHRKCHTVRRFAFTKILTGHKSFIDSRGFTILSGIFNCYGRASELLNKLNLMYDNQI